MSTQQQARKVEDSIADVVATRAVAATNLEEVPYVVRPGRSIAKLQAQNDLPGLEAELLGRTVPGRLVGVFAVGDPAKIATVAAFLEENGGIILDAGKLYADLAEYVEPSYGEDRVFRTTQYMRLTSAFRQQAAEVGLTKTEMPSYTETTCETQARTAEHGRNLIRAAAGDEVNLAVLKRAVVNAVVDRELAAKRIPVLVLNATAAEQAGLSPLFSKALEFDFQPTFEVDKESVVKIFKGN